MSYITDGRDNSSFLSRVAAFDELEVGAEEVEGEFVVEILAVQIELIDLPVVHVGVTLGAGVWRRRYFCSRAR